MVFTWVLRIIVLLIVLRLVLRFVRGLLQGLAGDGDRGTVGAGSAASRRSAASRTSAVPLVQDPVCGTYVVAASSRQIRAGRETHYFCSETCRRRFEDQQSTSRSA